MAGLDAFPKVSIQKAPNVLDIFIFPHFLYDLSTLKNPVLTNSTFKSSANIFHST